MKKISVGNKVQIIAARKMSLQISIMYMVVYDGVGSFIFSWKCPSPSLGWLCNDKNTVKTQTSLGKKLWTGTSKTMCIDLVEDGIWPNRLVFWLTFLTRALKAQTSANQIANHFKNVQRRPLVLYFIEGTSQTDSYGDYLLLISQEVQYDCVLWENGSYLGWLLSEAQRGSWL